MKLILSILTLAGFFFAVPSTVDAEKEHDHKNIGGPKGGRLLENTAPRAEFYVEKDRTVTITFYDDTLKPVAASEQSVTVIAKADGITSVVEFDKIGDLLISKSALPDVHALNLVVQVRQTPDTKPINFRFVYEDHICHDCKRAEYACICAH